MVHATILSIFVLIFSIPFLNVFVSYQEDKKVWKKWYLYVYMVSLFLFFTIIAIPTYPLNDRVKMIHCNSISIFLLISTFIVPHFLLNLKNDKGVIKYKLHFITICFFLYLLLIIAF